jgi:hypothetical protein
MRERPVGQQLRAMYSRPRTAREHTSRFSDRHEGLSPDDPAADRSASRRQRRPRPYPRLRTRIHPCRSAQTRRGGTPTSPCPPGLRARGPDDIVLIMDEQALRRLICGTGILSVDFKPVFESIANHPLALRLVTVSLQESQPATRRSFRDDIRASSTRVWNYASRTSNTTYVRPTVSLSGSPLSSPRRGRGLNQVSLQTP